MFLSILSCPSLPESFAFKSGTFVRPSLSLSVCVIRFFYYNFQSDDVQISRHFGCISKKEKRKKKKERKKLDYLNYIGLFNHPCVRVYSGRHSWPPSGTQEGSSSPCMHDADGAFQPYHQKGGKQGNRKIGKRRRLNTNVF